ISPMGRFTKNTERQPAYWVRKPPSDGPKALAIPNAALSSTCQRRRTCEYGNRSGMQAKAVPISMPTPMTCNARAKEDRKSVVEGKSVAGRSYPGGHRKL